MTAEGRTMTAEGRTMTAEGLNYDGWRTPNYDSRRTQL
jgi:hypothetical protein